MAQKRCHHQGKGSTNLPNFTNFPRLLTYKTADDLEIVVSEVSSSGLTVVVVLRLPPVRG